MIDSSPALNRLYNRNITFYRYKDDDRVMFNGPLNEAFSV